VLNGALSVGNVESTGSFQAGKPDTEKSSGNTV